jgi:hypothetical protein
MLRRLMLLIVCLVGPALLVWGLYQGTQYYLTVTHKFLDSKTQQYALIAEVAIFYLAGLMELRSRWSAHN